ncbi:hypothetical protein A0H77_19535 [Vibrio alginolyticus]|uniref:hypothetical protein n=1 Tax=Vibrio alginolyticus TaxID=663 RepID=UPI00079A861D|nr:hypothetical protein [Vibrio alginolyticus]KXZ35091.1 hypothetical protein A0H77_19535 [Vibrio alginolyticus]
MIHKEIRKATFEVKPFVDYIYYTIREKNGGKLDPNRANFFGNLDSDIDLKNWLETYGEQASPEILKKVIEKYVISGMHNIHQKSKSSKKWKMLDKNCECSLMSDRRIKTKDDQTNQVKTELIPQIPMRFSTHALHDQETTIIRQNAYNEFNAMSNAKRQASGCHSAEAYARKKLVDFLCLYTDEFEKEFYNEVKKESSSQTKKRRTKTKISDVQTPKVIHHNGDWTGDLHVHFVGSPFDPTTGLFCSPKNYVEIYKRVGEKLEQKYKHILMQGVARGLNHKQSENLKEKHLNELTSKFGNEKANEVYRQRFDYVSTAIDLTLSKEAMTFNKFEKSLAKKRIAVKKTSIHTKSSSKHYNAKNKDQEQFFEFEDQESGITFNNESFNGETRRKLKKFAKNLIHREALEKTLPDQKPYKVENVEKVLKDRLDRQLRKLHVELNQVSIGSTSPEEIKQKHFFEFYHSCLKVGIVPNLNKQKHLTYHKLAVNLNGRTEFKAYKYKSSVFSLDELQGNNIVDVFALDDETIMRLQLDYVMKAFPKRFMQYNVAYLNQSEITDEMELGADQEAYLLQGIENQLEKRNRELIYGKNEVFVVSKDTGEPTIKEVFDKNDSSKSTFYTNPLKPYEAAFDMLLIQQARLREKPDTIIELSSPDGVVHEHMRVLYVETIFNRDPNVRERLEIQNGYDESTQAKIDERLDTLLLKAEEKIEKMIDKPNRKSFNFTDAHLVYLLDTDLNEAGKQRVRDMLNKSIAKIEERGIHNITIAGKKFDQYRRDNEQQINAHKHKTVQNPRQKPNTPRYTM